MKLAHPRPADAVELALPGHGRRPPGGGSRAAAQGGFTLLELLVVIAIMALATAGVGLALRDSSATQLQREGERLAVLLESARAQSRASGAAVRWRADAQGFHFEGLPAAARLPGHWLDGGTSVRGPGELWLGPEPLIGAQQVVIVNQSHPGRAVRVATDGLRPFAAQAL
ncbi:prepilin-type N-terminal cleavage/methylation domain-containing protein [Alicycliphilus denitrificans]|uniref:prepilin-type N-terminal cleavage/methylation domain-containing protein n=1 Tax=Alicycliphilus denitrificans TaxID=179636 RepID=UPI0019164CDE|nr:prepilin-type N-terminal cleavage/methylation domain-containing protein [Alicycliphilus denitrificans]MBN9574871.1 prepilin-type N-terminal cleavage/methylation domain-containing protein [Alicycliphilus denitrificans]